MHHTDLPSAEPEYYTARQAAAKLGFEGPRKVYELMASGTLGSVTVRSRLRVPASALADYINALPRPEDLCSIAEAAARLQVSEKTIAELILDSDIEAVRIPGQRGRKVLLKSLDRYLAEARR